MGTDRLIMNLIRLYRSQVIRADKFLRSLCAPLDLHPLQARIEQIPYQDTLETPEGEVSYKFHGIGCKVVFEDYGVDFNFWHPNPIVQDVRFSDFNLNNFMYLSSKLRHLFMSTNALGTQLQMLSKEGIITPMTGTSYYIFS